MEFSFAANEDGDSSGVRRPCAYFKAGAVWKGKAEINKELPSLNRQYH
jgi:hypothetical protein